jgi:hypothetical protein
VRATCQSPRQPLTRGMSGRRPHGATSEPVRKR